MTVTAQPCIAFDVETTGVSAHEDRIVTAAIVEIRQGERPHTLTWLADPGVEIPDGAAEIHGITTEHAREHGRPIDDVLFEVTGRLALGIGHGLPLIAFNAAYDLTMLEAENTRHGIDTLVSRLNGAIRPVIDPMVLDKAGDPYRKGICPCGCGAQNKQLTGVCAHYGVVHTGAHDAAGDALAAARLWPRILDRHPGVFRNLTLSGLHQAQVGWRRKQMDGLRSYFNKNGIEHDGCDPAWPLLSAPVAPALGGGARG